MAGVDTGVGYRGCSPPPPQAERTWAVLSSICRLAAMELAPDDAGAQHERTSYVRPNMYINLLILNTRQ